MAKDATDPTVEVVAPDATVAADPTIAPDPAAPAPDPAPAADPAPVAAPTLCPICFPEGLPEGYITAGCEHSA